MGGKDPQVPGDSPVGEIDTRAPFESVKAALSLFGSTKSFGSGSASAPVDKLGGLKKSKTLLAERVLAKETRLQLAQKELNKYKEQLENAEITKAQAMDELEKAKSVVEELTNKLQVINESKDSAVEATQAANNQANQLKGGPSGDASWKQDLDSTREEYTASITELNAAKQELTKIRQDFEASMEAKAAAYQKAADAEQSAKASKERIEEIKKEIAAAEESIVEVKHVSELAQQEHAKILSEKEVQRETYKASLEELQEKLAAFKKEFDPELKGSLEAKLAETTAEIEALKKQKSGGNSVETVNLEIDEARGELSEFEEQECALKSVVDSLTLELESVRKEHSEWKEKEAQMESIAADLQVKLSKSKAELEAAVSDAKATHASDELNATLQQLALESENAKKEADDMHKSTEELRTEAESTRIALEEAEKKLEAALKEAEEAKQAEIQALYRIRALTEQTTAARAAKLESGGSITISKEEFESMNRRLEESDILAEMKVAAAMAQVEAVRASENEAQKKLETHVKEIEEMKSVTADALKKAEMAEAAKKAVECELQRWHEQEQKKAATASPASPAMILADTEMSAASSPRTPRSFEQTGEEPRKMEKSPVQRRPLFSSISGIFHRRKSNIEGTSASNLTSEKSP